MEDIVHSDKIVVKIPELRRAESEWIFNVVFRDFFGIEFHIETTKDQNFKICFQNKIIESKNVFLGIEFQKWLTTESLPIQPLKTWNVNPIIAKSLVESNVPIFFGEEIIRCDEDYVYLGIDFIGTLFFILSRYEELVIKERDNHGRFTAKSSILFKNNVLFRPIVDEYCEILWYYINSMWPNLTRKQDASKIVVTCDVDFPFDTSLYSFNQFIRNLLNDLFKRNFTNLFKRTLNLVASRFNIFKYDPNYTFDKFMSICEKNNVKAIFYFISENTGGKLDSFSSIKEKKVINLIKKILSRGHEIGQHGSYYSYKNVSQIIKEKSLLENLFFSENLGYSIEHNRQHYLRFDNLETPYFLEMADFKYDSTGCFADAPGFRFGTSKIFSMWDWLNYRELNLKQMPLVLMESSVIADRYMGLGYSKASLEFMMKIKDRALKYGNFVLLWHNSHFNNTCDFYFFEELVSNNKE